VADTLRRELKQNRPFRSPAQEGLIAIVRTSDQLRRVLERVIDVQGITGQQFNVLRILRGAAPDPLPVLEIGERMIEEAPGITRLLDRLEA
jgi:DNA-binding MarR family transcriptional regulator